MRKSPKQGNLNRNDPRVLRQALLFEASFSQRSTVKVWTPGCVFSEMCNLISCCCCISPHVMQRRSGTGPRVVPVKAGAALGLLLASAVISISDSILSACGDCSMKETSQNVPVAGLICLGRSEVSQGPPLPYQPCSSQATSPV